MANIQVDSSFSFEKHLRRKQGYETKLESNETCNATLLIDFALFLTLAFRGVEFYHIRKYELEDF